MLLYATPAIFLLPLAGFFALLIGGRRLGNPKAGWLATGAVALSFVTTAIVFGALYARSPGHRVFIQTLFSWLPVGGLHVDAAFRVDPLSMVMALFVTGVSAVIHLYSIGYMEHDEQFHKFFVYLNLFVFSMLILVLSNNFVLTFVGWEGVGACSYWLVAFWFDRDSAASAGKKAFIYNRVGDVGFLLAMFFMFDATGSLSYNGVFGAATSGHLAGTTATAICLLLFLGAVGKSAQIPLYPWLVDAMEGPTPVSALIHAATMVTAGVYLMTRVSPILARSPVAMTVVAAFGVVTAFAAAAAACAQQDIKKVLAYSTVSQLGYMFLAVGSGAYTAAIFLMITHAFYKALLFLGAGSVIHNLHDEQDLKKMGGLARYMPVTALTFAVAWFAIGGVAPLSGFWSKGSVLLGAFPLSHAEWALGVFTAILTAYYIGREFWLCFYGDERWQRLAQLATTHLPAGGGHGGGIEAAGADFRPRESRPVMLIPLVALAVASFFGGFIDLPFHPNWAFLDSWLAPVVGPYAIPANLSLAWKVGLPVIDGVVALVGVVVVTYLWRQRSERPALEPAFLLKGWRLDDLYDATIGRPGFRAAGFGADTFDPKVIDGAVNGSAQVIRRSARRVRTLQTGYVRNYALGVAAGA
ncbi:MAG TPA: NADH-quinone oxidoreductase subunit L, partial [Acidimicrobiales bacterium]|nr:NADH-quinone oxidoreductase subunit L [Acidimicrobiales bacterium]